jgi:predicted component of type VI protein secretion system
MLDLSVVVGAERFAGAPTTVRVPPGSTRFVIGRDPACDWALPDRTLALSARHCEIVCIATGPMLHDLSTNGTFVNGSALRLDGEHLLRDGDRIEIGPYTLVLRLTVPPAAPAVAPKSVEDTTPIVMPAGRGRDPAAAGMPLPEADDLGLTRIRPAPSAASAPPARGPLDGAAQPAPAAAPAAGLNARLALALGLPADALDDLPEDLLLTRLAGVLRAAVEASRTQLLQQARQRQAIGSRQVAALTSASPLQLASDTEQALRLLLGSGPDSLMQDAAADLSAHPGRLLAAFEAAGERLARDLAPTTLARAAAGGDATAREALYAGLWQRLGVAEPGTDWASGLRAALRLHLAAAYDAAG